MRQASLTTLTGAALVAVLGLMSGCATTYTGPRTSLSALPVPARAQVVVLDGAGGTEVTSRSLDQVVREDRLPLEVVPFDWSHGWLRFIADSRDREHLECQAQHLANYLISVRAARPNLPIHVLAYSAGTAVIARAAKYLPPNTLDRVVLLAPAIAAQTDIRRLLLASRQGVDVFTSDRDWVVLGIGTGIVGTIGGCYGKAAGREGFEPIVESPADARMYAARLRQFPWVQDYCWTGNIGQHGGGHLPRFLAAYIAPSFLSQGR